MNAPSLPSAPIYSQHDPSAQVTRCAGVVIVADLEPPYLQALAAAAEERGLAVAAPGDPRARRLCVVGINAQGAACPEDPSPMEAAPAAGCAVCGLVRELKRGAGSAPLILLARGFTVDHVGRVMRLGVSGVIEMPAPPKQVAERSLGFLGAGDAADDLLEIVGQNPLMREVRRQVKAVAATESTVLITGETGTGKGVVARAIHRLSGRSDGPFIHVDCSALPASVIESELFGHERGSFTGAVGRRAGRFELASKGTIFLDEIGDLDLPLQAKLLRVLQDREYELVGGSQTLAMTARVVAATNQDLRRAMAAGGFRRDLFFRLAVFHVQLPALREHLEDVPALARHGLQMLARSLGGAAPEAADEIYDRLMSHDWPGNVRELMNILERVSVQQRGGRLDPSDLDDALRYNASWSALNREQSLEESGEALHPLTSGGPDRRSAIAATLMATGGNIARAARRLAVPRGTLRYWIKQHGLEHLIPTD